MAGLTGKKSSTLRKQSIKESKLLTTGVKSLRFWHEAQSDGETTVDFGSLSLPAAISGQGFSNPSSAEIASANLALFHTNVEVKSSLNGLLMEGLTYKVKNAQLLFLNGYETTEGEIFEVTYKNDVITGTNVVDARPLTVTGVLTAGQTDFNVGEVFKTNQYPSQQMGDVMVFVDGVIQFRNVGNATAAPGADGNYQEVHAANGYGSIIRFNNTFASDTNIIVMSRNLIAERPDISMLQLIENLGGQIDKLVEYVAQDLGLDPLIFQTAPNEIDLQAFGDMVYQNKQDIASNLGLINQILDVQMATKTESFYAPVQSNFWDVSGAACDDWNFGLLTPAVATSNYIDVRDEGGQTRIYALKDITLNISAQNYTGAVGASVNILKNGVSNIADHSSAASGQRIMASANVTLNEGEYLVVSISNSNANRQGAMSINIIADLTLREILGL